jgi:hypothetical protein
MVLRCSNPLDVLVGNDRQDGLSRAHRERRGFAVNEIVRWRQNDTILWRKAVNPNAQCLGASIESQAAKPPAPTQQV